MGKYRCNALAFCLGNNRGNVLNSHNRFLSNKKFNLLTIRNMVIHIQEGSVGKQPNGAPREEVLGYAIRHLQEKPMWHIRSIHLALKNKIMVIYWGDQTIIYFTAEFHITIVLGKMINFTREKWNFLLKLQLVKEENPYMNKKFEACSDLLEVENHAGCKLVW